MAQQRSKLHIPAGVGKKGPVASPEEAYAQATAEFGEGFAEMILCLQGIDDSLATIALWAKRDGESRSIFSPDDFTDEEDGDDEGDDEPEVKINE